MRRVITIIALLNTFLYADKPTRIPCEVIERDQILCPNREIYASLRIILYVEQGLPPEILDGSIVRFYSRDGDNFVDWKDAKGNMHSHQFRVKRISLRDERDR